MERNIVFATTNVHKVKELSVILAGCGFSLVTRDAAGIDRGHEIKEDGETFEANSLMKATEVMRLTGLPAIADDSGIEIDFLGGAPGVHSARFADPKTDEEDFAEGLRRDASATRSPQDKANNAKLLRLLSGVPAEKRGGRYVAVITLTRPGEEPIVCRGKIAGRIGIELRGENGFGYDPLFIPEGYDIPFGLIAPEEKNKISHRYRALQGLREKLRQV